MKFNNKVPICFLVMMILLSGCSSIDFSGQIAYEYIKQQLDFGPRIPDTSNSHAFQVFLSDQLMEKGWKVENQIFEYKGKTLGNVIAKNTDNSPEIIIGTHYDTREFSDQEPDPNKRNEPVPGANDGASGTAILLELASLLDNSNLDIWLVFFDAEDQGGIDGWEWSIGAQKFVDTFEGDPRAVIIVDMVADDDLTIYREKNSSPHIADAIWETASQLGYSDIFVNEEKYAIIDDHLPFINKGLDAALLIDMDYAYWHTTADTIDHVSPTSLHIVGSVLLNYLNQYIVD